VLQVADGYQLYVERKGASLILKAKTIIITSNDEPSHWWPGKDLAPLWRRVHQGGGAYALWVDKPRITGPSGRLLQEGGLTVTYPEGAGRLPAVREPAPVEVRFTYAQRNLRIFCGFLETVSVSRWWG